MSLFHFVSQLGFVWVIYLFIYFIPPSNILLSGKYSRDVCFECFCLTLADMAISRTHAYLQVYRPSVQALKDTCIASRRFKIQKAF